MALLTMRDGTQVSTTDFDHTEDWHGFIADAMSPEMYAAWLRNQGIDVDNPCDFTVPLAGWAASPFAARVKARRDTTWTHR